MDSPRIGGPVGAGKTTLTASLIRILHPHNSVGVITNDIYTQEDAEALMRMQILPRDRVIGVETGGCPHTAIREDASINLAAIAQMHERYNDIEIIFIESGGDNLSATFSPELADLTVYVIDVAAGEEIPRKGGPAITKSDILVINKTDLGRLVSHRGDLRFPSRGNNDCEPRNRRGLLLLLPSPASGPLLGIQNPQPTNGLACPRCSDP